tara:strand:- start:7861 stop:8946 length:1086 start_codon:yes stop_codon:yes gene_type:complete
MGLSTMNTIFGYGGLEPTQFDLGSTSTLQQSSLPLVPVDSPYQDLDGNPGPTFTLGSTSTLQQNSLFNLPQQSQYQDTDGTDGGNGYFHGLDNPGKGQGLQINGVDLHVHLLGDTITYSNGNSTATVGEGIGGSEYMDLEGEPPEFDDGPGSTLQTDSLLNLYNYSHGGVSGVGGPIPGKSQFQDLNSTFDSNGDIINFNRGTESPQDPLNPLYDTIHEQSLLAPKKSEDLDLNGKTPSNIRQSDKAFTSHINKVPGGITPSAYADLNGTKNVNSSAPDGAPVPNDLFFMNDRNPTKYKGLQIKNTDLHEHLLHSSYTYSHGLSSTIIKPSTSDGDRFTYQDLDIDVRKTSPSQYIDKLPK